MQSTPRSNRIHVGIFGETNSGKSSLFNAILESDVSIVSDVSGTTTDPILKSMELNPFGPIVLIDTAGLNDKTELGHARAEKTENIFKIIDFAIYCIDINSFSFEKYEETKKKFESIKVPLFIVFTKQDIANTTSINSLTNIENSIIISIKDKESIKNLKEKLVQKLSKIELNEKLLLDSIAKKGDVIILVTPMDSEAPKGRLILAQSQLIRECVDSQITCVITNELNLKNSIENLKRIDLVITDSQIFKLVNDIIPQNIPLTSFSILFARQKGEIDIFYNGVNKIKDLNDTDIVLIAENCIHNKSHEDIGHVKIPNAIKKISGKNINFEFKSGHDFPNDLRKYSLIVHCGGCMVTRTTILNRIEKAKEQNIPITNYGMVLAYANCILEKSLEIYCRR